MEHLPEIALAFGAFALGMFSPGPNILSVVGHIAYAVAFSTRRVVALYDRARRWIDAGLGVFFAFAGIKLLISRT
jgi:threonine/homoserine/homoserine lactone efflux protein